MGSRSCSIQQVSKHTHIIIQIFDTSNMRQAPTPHMRFKNALIFRIDTVNSKILISKFKIPIQPQKL